MQIYDPVNYPENKQIIINNKPYIENVYQKWQLTEPPYTHVHWLYDHNLRTTSKQYKVRLKTLYITIHNDNLYDPKTLWLHHLTQ